MSDNAVFCPSCGARNERGAVFCAQCGRGMGEIAPPAPAAAPSTQRQTGRGGGFPWLPLAIVVGAVVVAGAILLVGRLGRPAPSAPSAPSGQTAAPGPSAQAIAVSENRVQVGPFHTGMTVQEARETLSTMPGGLDDSTQYSDYQCDRNKTLCIVGERGAVVAIMIRDQKFYVPNASGSPLRVGMPIAEFSKAFGTPKTEQMTSLVRENLMPQNGVCDA